MTPTTPAEFRDASSREVLNSLIDPLTASERQSARLLQFKDSTDSQNIFERSASFATSEKNALLRDLFKIYLTEGEYYSIDSVSYFDPFVLIVFDQVGNPIFANLEKNDYSSTKLSDGGNYSHDNISAFVAPYTGYYYTKATWDQGSYYNFVYLGIFNYRNNPADFQVVEQGDFSGNDYIFGTFGSDYLVGEEGSDTLVGAGGDDYLIGGSGLDRVDFSGLYSDYSTTRDLSQPGVYIVSDKLSNRDGIDKLYGVERLKFSDASVALDTDGANSAGGIYRIYKAAFNRTPDAGGLGFWINELDKGQTSTDMAIRMTYSDEFQRLYGIQTADNYMTGVNANSLVSGFYKNVLGRQPDQNGLDFYANSIISKQKTVGQVLAEIADSSENYVNTVGLIEGGVYFSPFI
ncbi:MAG: DUF4214 domain-containing protein [Burkholderiaceae bacterium]|nr:DUF4214 domain-containing protein [Burkholderiaceae bacterium]